MNEELVGWIAEQRAVCAVQKQRWEGVAPERLEEACRRLEQMQAQKDLMIERLLAEVKELRGRAASPQQIPAGMGGAPRIVVRSLVAPAPSFVVPVRLDRWSVGVWTHSGLPVWLEGQIPTPSPAMQSAYEAGLQKIVGTMIELPIP